MGATFFLSESYEVVVTPYGQWGEVRHNESILGNYTWKSSVKNNLNIYSPESLDDSPAADKEP